MLGSWPGLAAVAGAALVMFPSIACSSTEQYRGTEITPPRTATSFELQNQFGQPVRLSDYRGKVLVLTFLYTTCADECPAAAVQLRQAHEILSDESEDVAFVAVSVDPKRDTVDAAYAFSQHWGMLDAWDFLVGDSGELSAVWEGYYIDPVVPTHAQASHDGPGSDGTDSQLGDLGSLRRELEEKYIVIHPTPVYLIDREGLMRFLLTPPLDPVAIRDGVALLLR